MPKIESKQLIHTTATQLGWERGEVMGEPEYTKDGRSITVSFGEDGYLVNAVISRPRGNGLPARVSNTSFVHKVLDELAR
jgi:hypothetical protein